LILDRRDIMKILVAGGAGYIGSHTVYELIDNGADVVIIDSLETGHIEAVHPKARFYQGDIRDRAFLDDVLTKEKNIDGVIHFAANSLVGESMTNPLKYYDNNVYGTKVLLEKLIEYGINHVVIFVYGSDIWRAKEYPDRRDRSDTANECIW